MRIRASFLDGKPAHLADLKAGEPLTATAEAIANQFTVGSYRKAGAQYVVSFVDSNGVVFLFWAPPMPRKSWYGDHADALARLSRVPDDVALDRFWRSFAPGD
jgi:hypothetical protein